VNVDWRLVNRSLLSIGESFVEQQDIIDNNEKVKTIKEMYLTTFLEALTEIDWTSARVGKALIETNLKSVYKPYEYEYELPIDCAKPLKIQGEARFSIQGRSIFSEVPDAILLYITSGCGSGSQCGQPRDAYNSKGGHPKRYSKRQENTFGNSKSRKP
jgi:hypothetical protein